MEREEGRQVMIAWKRSRRRGSDRSDRCDSFAESEGRTREMGCACSGILLFERLLLLSE